MKTKPPSALRSVLRRVRDAAARLRRDAAWRRRKRRVARAMARPPEHPAADALRGATLFYVPYAGVTPFLSQACVLARTLKERGHRVVLARCFRLFDRCPVMDMRQLPYVGAADELKRDVCLRCADNALSMPAEYGLDVVDLRTIATPEMTARIDAAVAAAPADLLDFEFDGVQFGKLSVTDVVLMRKISDLGSLSDVDRAAWRQYLQSALLSYLLVDRLCSEFGIARVVHVNDYSLLLAARTAARRRAVPCYTLAFPAHRNIDMRRYLVLPEIWRPISFKLLEVWRSCRDFAIEPDRVREIADDLIFRFAGRGSHIYSPGKSAESSDVRARLGLSTDRRLIVAYTSSVDEVMATRMGMAAMGFAGPDRPQPFSSQVEWLRALVEHVEASDDLQLAVRVHPREGPNKRESVASQHLEQLRAALGGRYRHSRVIWPEDPVSSYDVGEAAELVLISWSTIGLEMARLGAPVLVAFNGGDVAVPWDDFHEWAPTPDAYFAKLRELLNAPVTRTRIARAFRWYNLFTFGTTVDVADVVPRSDFGALPPYQTPSAAESIERILIGGEEACARNIDRLARAQGPDAAARESAELDRQMRRLVHFLMTGADPEFDAPLTVELPGEGALALRRTGGRAGAEGARAIAIDGFQVTYDDGDRRISRFSPMAARLALACVAALPPVAAAGVRS